MKKKLDLYCIFFVYCSIRDWDFKKFFEMKGKWRVVTLEEPMYLPKKWERCSYLYNNNTIISVPQHSLLTIARISDDKRRRNIQCAQYWKWEGHPRLLERGISSTPYTVRPIGLHSLATIRFQKMIKWLYRHTSYYNWRYCHIGPIVSTPFLWGLFVTNCYILIVVY